MANNPIFQFTIVGNPQRIAEEAKENLIYFNPSDSSAFLNQLNQGTFNSLDEVQALARMNRQARGLFASAGELNKRFGNERAAADWLDRESSRNDRQGYGSVYDQDQIPY